jgi:acyl carrier protein
MSSEGITIEQAVDAVNQILGGRRTGGTTVDGDTRFLDLGLDSLDVSELFLMLEETADQRLDPASAGELQRVSDLTNLRPMD